MQSTPPDPRSEHLLTAAMLAAELAGDAPPVLLDVRWGLRDEPGAGRLRYGAEHLPGARFLDLESVLTSHSDDPRQGRHPLPDGQTLTSGLAAVGVGAGGDVVVYDEPGSFAAERAWWVLRWAGIRARVLDGGVTAWLAVGLPTESSGSPAAPAALAVTEAMSRTQEVAPGETPPLQVGQLPTLTADEAASLPGRGALLDARAPERFRGDVEPLDPRAGHIPGALNLSAAGLYAADGTMPGDEQLAVLLADAAAHATATAHTGAGDTAAPSAPSIGVYCGSGVSAARTVLAFAAMGRAVALFPGSWSAWSNDPDRPAATGP